MGLHRNFTSKRLHAGLYHVDIGAHGFYVIRKRGLWWVMYGRDYKDTPYEKIGPGNAVAMRSLAACWRYMETLAEAAGFAPF